MRYFCFLLLVLASCGAADNQTADKPLVKSEVSTPAQAKIRNNIQVQSNGVKVEQAFLTYEDGTLVPADNVTAINKKLLLNLVVSGWEEKDGSVQLEASEKVTTSEGQVILDVPDLFTQSGLQSLSAKDARYLRLNVVITGINELSDYYKVEFKVWNQYTQQFIYGTYQFSVA